MDGGDGALDPLNEQGDTVPPTVTSDQTIQVMPIDCPNMIPPALYRRKRGLNEGSPSGFWGDSDYVETMA
jgi:hypothetical protein